MFYFCNTLFKLKKVIEKGYYGNKKVDLASGLGGIFWMFLANQIVQFVAIVRTRKKNCWLKYRVCMMALKTHCPL